MSSAITAAVVVGGASYLSSKAQSKAAAKAGDSASASAAYAAEEQGRQFDKMQENQKPWLQQGTAAINQLGTGVLSGAMSRPFEAGDMLADPGYQFRMSEGIKALDRSASASGGLASGGALKAITRFGQDTASNEYQNAYNRYTGEQATKYNQLASLAGVGQTAANTLGQAGQQYAGNVGNIAMSNAATQGNVAIAQGNAQASAYQGYGNALSAGISGLSQHYGQKNQQQQQSSGWINPDTGRAW
jgi:hypothetical protein